MAQPGQPPPAMLICGLISSRTEWLTAAADALIAPFGPVELASEATAFDFTHYYDAEMGTPLLRQFIAFQRPFDPAGLADAKLVTNAIEADFAGREGPTPPRPINLDPGYLESSKLVLASMKNFSHRVYLRSGVFAEVTLQYRRGRWTALEWTFPDYASGRYDAFLSSARESLRGREGAADAIARAAAAGGEP